MRNNIIKTENYRGHNITVEFQEYAEHPFDDFSFLGNYHLDFGRRYEGRQNFKNRELPYPDDFIDCANFLSKNIVFELNACDNGSNGADVYFRKQITSPAELMELLAEDEPSYCFIPKTDIRKEFSVGKVTQQIIEQTEKIITSEVKTLSAYYQDEVFIYFVTDANDEIVNSCGGFYGFREMEYIFQYAKDNIDAIISYDQKKNQEQALQFGLNKFAIV